MARKQERRGKHRFAPLGLLLVVVGVILLGGSFVSASFSGVGGATLTANPNLVPLGSTVTLSGTGYPGTSNVLLNFQAGGGPCWQPICSITASVDGSGFLMQSLQVGNDPTCSLPCDVQVLVFDSSAHELAYTIFTVIAASSTTTSASTTTSTSQSGSSTINAASVTLYVKVWDGYNSKPVSGTLVYLDYPTTNSATTDSAGTASLGSILIGQTYSVHTAPQGYNQAYASVTAPSWASGSVTVMLTVQPVTTSTSTTSSTITTSTTSTNPIAIVTVIVTDQVSGNPISAATATLGSLSQTTGANGQALFSTVAANNPSPTLIVTANGYQSQTIQMSLAGGNFYTVRVALIPTLVCPCVVVVGVVDSFTGFPIQGANVNFGAQNQITNFAGQANFTISSSGLSPLVLSASVNGYQTWSTQITLTRQNMRVQIALVKPNAPNQYTPPACASCSIIVQVLDVANGQAIQGATVTLDTGGSQTSNSFGKVGFTGIVVPPANHDLLVSASGYKTQTVLLVITQGSTYQILLARTSNQPLVLPCLVNCQTTTTTGISTGTYTLGVGGGSALLPTSLGAGGIISLILGLLLVFI